MKMFTILVPTKHRISDRPIRTRFHRVWDEKVRAITGGLTILSPSKGQWVCPEGQLYAERMIPVMFAGTDEQRDKIMKITLEYYDQLSIICWETSSSVVFLTKEKENVG